MCYEPEGPRCVGQYVGSKRLKCKPAPVLSDVKLTCITKLQLTLALHTYSIATVLDRRAN